MGCLAPISLDICFHKCHIGLLKMLFNSGNILKRIPSADGQTKLTTHQKALYSVYNPVELSIEISQYTLLLHEA